MNSNNIIKQHPEKWVGRSFVNKGTKNIFKVKEIRKSATGSRYRVLLESSLVMLNEIGFDSRVFRKNFTPYVSKKMQPNLENSEKQ